MADRHVRQNPVSEVGDVPLPSELVEHLLGSLADHWWWGVQPARIQVPLQGYLRDR